MGEANFYYFTCLNLYHMKKKTNKRNPFIE